MTSIQSSDLLRCRSVIYGDCLRQCFPIAHRLAQTKPHRRYFMRNYERLQKRLHGASSDILTYSIAYTRHLFPSLSIRHYTLYPPKVPRTYCWQTKNVSYTVSTLHGTFFSDDSDSNQNYPVNGPALIPYDFINCFTQIRPTANILIIIDCCRACSFPETHKSHENFHYPIKVANSTAIEKLSRQVLNLTYSIIP